MIRTTLIALIALPMAAQTDAKPLVPSEESIIQRFRSHSKPRQVNPPAPMSAEEKNIIRRFKEARPSVVFVSAILKNRDPKTHDITKIPTGSGTGFVWDEWGHIVTNHHVISVEQGGKLLTDVEEVEVTVSDGKTYKGRVIGASFAYDIAVIQAFAPPAAMRPIPIGRSSSLLVGQSVLAIGNPYGLDHSLSTGVISALGREIATGYNTWILNSIQTDAAINPGNSGGPLLDSGGRLIGMNTAIVATKGEGSVGVGFAIPVDTLNRIVPQLIAKERLEPPRVGGEGRCRRFPSGPRRDTGGGNGHGRTDPLHGRCAPGLPGPGHRRRGPIHGHAGGGAPQGGDRLRCPPGWPDHKSGPEPEECEDPGQGQAPSSDPRYLITASQVPGSWGSRRPWA
jgi:S1-C subfamily serine protease